jgi:hypothetical protein
MVLAGYRMFVPAGERRRGEREVERVQNTLGQRSPTRSRQ